MELLFWFSIFMVFYAYFGYPLCLLTILAIRYLKNAFSRASDRQGFEREKVSPGSLSGQTTDEIPTASLIITAYNEERRIREKIENTLALVYPEDRLEIIVASDNSSDATDQIVREYASKGIKLVRAPERGGKENAQKCALQKARGDILIFSDVATILDSDAIEVMTRNFKDVSVGCVSSTDKFIENNGKRSGEGLYVKYEMFLRSIESKVYTLVGLSGSFFAARKSVCQKWSTDLQSDFNTLLNSIKLGMRGIIDPNSVGYYLNIADEQKEFDRKVRTVLRGVSVLMRNLELLNPVKFGLFAWKLFSHKLCRWLVPFFLISTFFTNAILAFRDATMAVLFFCQLCLYALCVYYYVESKKKDRRFLNNSKIKVGLRRIAKIPYYFVSVNLSIVVAWMRYVKGERATYWEPSKR